MAEVIISAYYLLIISIFKRLVDSNLSLNLNLYIFKVAISWIMQKAQNCEILHTKKYQPIISVIILSWG